MEFRGESAETISRVVNGALFILHGKDLTEARIYLGFEEWYALRCLEYGTRLKVGFNDHDDNPTLLGCRVFRVIATSHFEIYLGGN